MAWQDDQSKAIGMAGTRSREDAALAVFEIPINPLDQLS
jgi:hypothetical protein